MRAWEDTDTFGYSWMIFFASIVLERYFDKRVKLRMLECFGKIYRRQLSVLCEKSINNTFVFERRNSTRAIEYFSSFFQKRENSVEEGFLYRSIFFIDSGVMKISIAFFLTIQNLSRSTTRYIRKNEIKRSWRKLAGKLQCIQMKRLNILTSLILNGMEELFKTDLIFFTGYYLPLIFKNCW